MPAIPVPITATRIPIVPRLTDGQDTALGGRKFQACRGGTADGNLTQAGVALAPLKRGGAYSRPMSNVSEGPGNHRADEVRGLPALPKTAPLCICDSITPIESRVSLLILQHPQEQDRALGTARLTALHFKDAVLKIGLSWPSLSKALGRPVADPSRWAVLYLGSAKVADLDTDRDIVAINRKGEIEDNQRAILRGHRRHGAARRHLEPGQGAVVAQCLDAEMPARDSRPQAAVALRGSCAASRAATGSRPSRRRRCCSRPSKSGPISRRR